MAPTNVALLHGRKLVATACNGDLFGPMVSQIGGNFLGYTGSLVVGLVSTRLHAAAEHAFLTGPRAVAAGTSVDAASRQVRRAFSALANQLSAGKNGPLPALMLMNGYGSCHW